MDFYLLNEKISDEEYHKLLDSKNEEDKPPKLILLAPRLFTDSRILEALFVSETPAIVPVCFVETAKLFYCFFDASSRG